MNVPSWRLFLSKSLSRMYSVILDDRMYTYTSCCRVYRKRAFENFEPENSGFLGVAETLIELKRNGGRIVEYPATLESRLFGESKMKVVRTIGRHLGLLQKLATERLTGKGPVRENSPQPVASSTAGEASGASGVESRDNRSGATTNGSGAANML
jgi:dolichol-phosphate mannosyltransferase